MRNAFQLKASSSARLSAVAPKLSPTATEPGGKDATTRPVTEQVSSLSTAQRHLPGIRMWFEQGKEADARAAGGEDGVGGGGGGGAGGTSLSTIKAVYTEAWGEDDGRFNALAFLFTLCAVPRDNVATFDVKEGEDNDGERYAIVSGGVEVILSTAHFLQTTASCGNISQHRSPIVHTVATEFSADMLHIKRIPYFQCVDAEMVLGSATVRVCPSLWRTGLCLCLGYVLATSRRHQACCRFPSPRIPLLQVCTRPHVVALRSATLTTRKLYTLHIPTYLHRPFDPLMADVIICPLTHPPF